MVLDILRSFSKDIDRLPDRKLRQRLMQVLIDIEQAKDIYELGQVKKLKGIANAYRLRVGDYRLGFFLVDDVVRVARFVHRKEFYRYFP